jgi:hypothetical protein
MCRGGAKQKANPHQCLRWGSLFTRQGPYQCFCNNGEATKSSPWFIVSVNTNLNDCLIQRILWFGMRNVNRY